MAELEELAEEILTRAATKVAGKSITLKALETHPKAEEIFKEAAAELEPILKTKSFHAGVPLLFGILGTGIGLGFLNRYMTQTRYTKQNPNPPVVPAFSPFSVPPPQPFFSAQQNYPMPMQPMPLSASPFSQAFPTQAMYSKASAIKPPSPQTVYSHS